MDWSQWLVPSLRSLEPYRAGITEEKLRRDTGLDNILKFSSNESPIGPSLVVAAAMYEEIAQANRYPDGAALIDKLSARLGVPAECILLGNGSIDLIESLVRAIVAPQHEVLLSEYGYCAYRGLVKAQGATVRIAPSGANFGHDVMRLLERIDARTRLVLLDSPTNLSGRALRAAELDHFIDGLPEHVLLVLDEAYAEYVDSGAPAHTQRLPLRHPKVVVTRTFSKAYGLAGMRIGYAIASPGLVDGLKRFRPPFPVNRVALAGASAALDDIDHLDRIVTSAREGRRRLGAALRALGAGVVEGSANFVLADFGRAAGLVHHGLLASGFITRAMHAYGLPTHIRIAVGTAGEVDRLVDAITSLIAAFSSPLTLENA